MGSSPVFVESPNLGVATIENADGTNVADVFTAGASGSRIENIFAIHDDVTAAVMVLLWMNDGVNTHLLGSIPMVVATAGTPRIEGDYLQSVAWLGSDASIVLPAGHKIQASLQSAITASSSCSVYAIGGDF